MSTSSKPPLLSEKPPLLSELAGDPDMLELIQEFVRALPDRVNAIVEALGSNDLATLRRLAHQLKGAGGGYGFGSISQAAAALESSARAATAVGELTAEVQELIALCQRARSTAP